MRVTIELTKAEIKRGTQHCGTECPVLLALHSVFGKGVVDRVTRAYIVFKDGHRKRSPVSVREFCRDYDRGGPEAVEPFAFSLNLSTRSR